MIEPDPTARVSITLPEHLERPEAKRPVFCFYLPRVRDARRLSAIIRRAEDARAALGTGGLGAADQDNVADSIFDEALEVLRSLLADWTHQTDARGKPVAFDPEALDRVVTEGQVMQLVVLLRVRGTLSVADRKKSESPSGSSRATSATVATPDAAPTGAAIGPAPTDRSSCNAPNATATGAAQTINHAPSAAAPATG